MDYISSMKFEDVKIRFPRLAEDINNVLIRYDNRILLESIKGYCYGIHTLNGELHNSDGTCVIFECIYKRGTVGYTCIITKEGCIGNSFLL